MDSMIEIKRGDTFEVKNGNGQRVGTVLVSATGLDPYKVFGYFFREQVHLTARESEFACLFSALPIMDGDWKRCGHLDSYKPEDWPVPEALAQDAFGRDRVNVVTYDPESLEETSRKSVPSTQISPQRWEGAMAPSLFGGGAAAIKLESLIKRKFS